MHFVDQYNLGTCVEQVRKIVLNFNSINDKLDVDAWSNLADVLQELYLGDCKLRSLPLGTFNNMHQLRYLHLWNNQISVIPANFFQVILSQLYA